MIKKYKTVFFFSFYIIVSVGCSNSSKIFRYEDPENDELFVQREFGAKVFIEMNDGEEYKGELLRVLDSTMILCENYRANDTDLSDFEYTFYSLNNHNIKPIELSGENHLIGGIIFGGLGGALSGLIITAALAYHTSDFDAIGYAAGGLLIGAGIGMLTGGIIGANNTTFDEVIYEYTNPEEYDFKKLNIYARYGASEPEYLEAIK
jgi:hypothetical protein